MTIYGRYGRDCHGVITSCSDGILRFFYINLLRKTKIAVALKRACKLLQAMVIYAYNYIAKKINVNTLIYLSPKISSAETSKISQIFAKVSSDGYLSFLIYLLTVEGLTPNFSASSFCDILL